MRLCLFVATTAALASCAPPLPLPTPTPGNDTRLQDELFAADRAYARAVADSGHAAWVARFAPDIAKPGTGGLILLRGPDPVGGLAKGMFADPSRVLVWEPSDAVAYADGRTGVTVGRSAWVRSTTRSDTLSRGRYLTMWQRQADGAWKIILDTGWPEE
jgi:ketosteroid isomerase-like protein